MIPFYKPPGLEQIEKNELLHIMGEVLDSGNFTDGQLCRRLEEEVKQLYHVDYAFVAPNATVALQTLVKVLDPSVIYTPAFTWKSLENVFYGRQVQWFDIDRDTWLPVVNTSSVSDTLFILNHTFGNTGHTARGYLEKIIYDGAQAFGAKIKDIGDATVFGFAPTKPVTCGEGGMIVTNDSEIADLLEAQRHILLRMSEFNVAVGLAYLRKMSDIQEQRRKIWHYYNNHLPYPHQEIPHNHSLSVYGILVSERAKLIERIKDKMEFRVYYEPLTRGLANTDWVYSQILCIPSYAGCPYKEIVELLT